MIFFKFVDPETNKESDVHKIDVNELKKYLLSLKIKVSMSPVYGDTNRFVTHHYIGQKEV